jgi:crossover junction endodeoxyribonuclease RuvC
MILGCDPGVHGAFALLSHENGRPTVRTFDIPALKISVNKGIRTQLDLAGVVSFLVEHRLGIVHAIIENPHAMPGQGVSSSFSFGFACGALQSALVAMELPTTTIRPAIWKRKLGLSADKDETRRRASQIFPTCASQWARKCDDGRAEAALLAYWGQMEGLTL